ncbi:MAG: homocysteine S-methyltransferase [Acidimicrobiia bacterium]
MFVPTLAHTLRRRPVVLDGGLSTELEAQGHDLSGSLWSARLLRDDPEAVLQAHLAFARAGAEVAITASYQAGFEGFAAAGLDRRETTALLVRSVELARRAMAGRGWVAASVGPYGAALAGGEEYTGGYAAVDPAVTGGSSTPDRSRDTPPAGGMGVEELLAWHLPRMRVLADAGADVLACETVPAATEAAALVAALEELQVDGWLSLTTTVDEHGVVRTRRGEPAAAVLARAAASDRVVAVGVNCIDPAGAGAAIAAAARSGKPVVCYPNGGGRWDPAARRWRQDGGFPAGEAASWLRAGARLVGGCCRATPADIAALTATVSTAGTIPSSTIPSSTIPISTVRDGMEPTDRDGR